MEGKSPVAHHGFTHTTVHHHADGSHTIQHHHHEGPHKDIHHAVADHDGMIDSMMDHTSAPNLGETQANAGPQAAPAGIPGAAPAAGA